MDIWFSGLKSDCVDSMGIPSSLLVFDAREMDG